MTWKFTVRTDIEVQIKEGEDDRELLKDFLEEMEKFISHRHLVSARIAKAEVVAVEIS